MEGSGDMRRRLIEESLPIRELSVEGAREKNIRHGHPSGIHQWWARRPLVASRAAVFASLVDDPGDPESRADLQKFICDLCTWEASMDEEKLSRAQELIQQSLGGRTGTVLDPFAGGGTIPLEALRLGCNTHSFELNPVAHVVQLATVLFPRLFGGPGKLKTEESLESAPYALFETSGTEDVPNLLAAAVQRWGTWIRDRVQGEIGDLYPLDDAGEVPVAYLWARTVACPNPSCGAEIPLLKTLWLAKKSSNRTAKANVALRMTVDEEQKRVDFSVAFATQIDFDPAKGSMGARASAICPVCKQAVKAAYLKAEGADGRMGERMTAVITARPGSKSKNYLSVREFDLTAYDTAAKRLEEIRSQELDGLSPLPDEPIPSTDTRAIFVQLYGIKTWDQLYNSRQLVSLESFVRNVRLAGDLMKQEDLDPELSKAVVTMLACLVDRLADFGSTLCVLNTTGGRGVKGTFARGALPMTWDYAESNPFNPLGADWSGSIERLVKILGRIPKGPPAEVRRGTATRLPYPSHSFDAVITDPPYADNIPYSDLSDYFYVWLKRMLADLYPGDFRTILTPKAAEIVEQPSAIVDGRPKDAVFFRTEMRKALDEIYRVLDPDEGIAVVVFAHKKTTEWEGLLESMLDAGLTVTASWPLVTEKAGRLRSQKSAALATSVWVVCRPRLADAGIGRWKEVRRELAEKVRSRLDHFLDQGIRGADALLATFGPALEAFGRYERVETVQGEWVTVAQMLDEVRRAVAQHALEGVLEGHRLEEIDEVTAFYVLWRWTFDARTAGPAPKSIVADEARKLWQAVGADPDVISGSRGVLVIEKEAARLLGPSDRRNQPQLGEIVGGHPPYLIDVLHKAAILWKSGGTQVAEDYLQEAGMRGDETLQLVARALSHLLPEDSDEKRLYDGLLAAIGPGAQGRLL